MKLDSWRTLAGLTGHCLLARTAACTGCALHTGSAAWTAHSTWGTLRASLWRLHPRYCALTHGSCAGLTAHRLAAQSGRRWTVLSARASLHRLTGSTGSSGRTRSTTRLTGCPLGAGLRRLHPRYRALSDGACASLTPHGLTA